MYLRQMKKQNGRIYLAIYEGYRDEFKKPRSRMVMKIGYLDEVSQLYDDPIKHFTELAAKMTADKQRLSSHSMTIDLHAHIENGLNLLNVGYLPFKYVYNEIGLNDFCKIMQKKLNIQYSLNKNLELLIFSRIFYPGSKKQAYENRNRFFAPFDKGITEDSVYDCLDILDEYKDKIQKLIWEKTKDVYERDSSKSYYDCTNYYFEIEHNDDDILDDEGHIIEKGLRKRGPEKNRRPDPIVEMGLLMDSTGIPMAYDLFPGNESEKTSLRPLLKKTKAAFGIERTIVVADRGLNTSDNIYFLAGKNDKEENHMDGYVYGQSVRGADKEFKEWVLDTGGYHTEIIEEDGKTIAFTHKSRVQVKELRIERNGKRNVKVNVCQKQMAYFSYRYLMKQREDRYRMIKKAKEMIKKPGSYTKATSYGAAGYIKNIEFDKKTGEMKTDKELHIDWDKIAEEERYDGYYSIVTSEIELNDHEMRKIYRGLAKIEDTFRISKSIFNARPAYVWTPAHIRGHFFTCFVALVIARLVEKRLGRKYTVEQIIESTKKYDCINIDMNIYQFIYKDKIIEDIGKEFQVELDRKYRKKEEIKKILKY